MRTLVLVTIAILLIMIVVLGRAVVRLENYHYASEAGTCEKFKFDASDPQKWQAREDCLNNTETRTHWFWHILYGTGVL